MAISAAVLRFYESLSLGTMIDHFHYTFITMGIVTVASALVFMLLRRKDGRNLISGRKQERSEGGELTAAHRGALHQLGRQHQHWAHAPGFAGG